MKKISENILSWCNNPEEGAIEQAINISNHPWLIGNVCLMPDVHAGFGMPIGGVVALDRAICPNMVGVDIGCTDGETEFLSPTGWIKIKDYDGENILIYDNISNCSYFQKPLAFINKHTNKFNVLKNQVVDQVLTDEHKVILFSSRTGKPYVQQLNDLIDKNRELKKGINHLFRNYIPNYKSTSTGDYSDDDIRLIIAISADGRVRGNNVEFHFRKERKIQRLKELCNNLNIAVNEHNRQDGSYGCTINYSKGIKDLTPLYCLNRHQLSVVVDEVLYWDGHIAKDGQMSYSSTNKANIDFVQFAFAVCGVRSNYSIHNKDGWNTCYNLYSTGNNHTCFPRPDQITTITGDNLRAYCFTTSTGFWFMRRNGKIAITGNCGMLACQTSLKSITKQQLEDVYYEIKKCIPVGFKHNSEKQEHEIFTNFMWNSPSNPVCEREFESAQYQIGTLGGGNHFIEIQRDDDGFIWFMIHSGSRNLGKQVAEFYNKEAERLCEMFRQNKIVEDELAVLPVGTIEFERYKCEMELCLKFAQANRDLMAKKIAHCFGKVIDNCCFPYEIINIHHNYASLEHHYGRDVFVHRKGATLARKNTIGIIPGSQGTASYIVQGLGNEASLCSCSHGAGRKMSRKKARENLDLEAEQNKMNDLGILHSLNSIESLDESSSAYKDIDTVMEEQKDLVKIIKKLTPLAVVKG